MTFQPEECSSEMKKNLSDQRVRELLGNHIPVDEAKLLSNGRITCLICLHRPIFDTTNMLAVHRRGKRHLSELEKFLKRKEELALMHLKSKQLKQNHGDEKFLLGCKSAKFKSLSMKRKPRLDFINSKRPSTIPTLPRSEYSQVKSYIKKSGKMRSFSDFIEEVREGQRPLSSSVPKSNETKLGSEKRKPKEKCPEKILPVSDEMQCRMSGWIKDASGKWIKDPEAEFDSDEETPSLLINC